MLFLIYLTQTGKADIWVKKQVSLTKLLNIAKGCCVVRALKEEVSYFRRGVGET